MVKKNKRAKITPKGLSLIWRRALEYPRARRTPLAEQLQRELEMDNQDVPEIEVLERKISWFRNHETDDPQDKSWYPVALAKYEIPPEVLPLVLKMDNHCRQTQGRPLTIREARWVARLSSVAKKGNLRKLFGYILEYAWAEKVAEGMDIMDDFEAPTDDRLYVDLVGKWRKEPIFDDITGKEIPSEASALVMEGLKILRQNKQPVSKKARGGKS